MTEPQIQSLFLELLKKKIYIFVRPIDDWDCWTYTIEMTDAMSPFFTAYRHDGEFNSYMDALEHGVNYTINILQTLKAPSVVKPV